MAPPTPIGSFIPPVTGIHSLAPVANRFDTTGNFRSRTGSYKRKKPGESGAYEEIFDLSREYPPPVYPKAPGMDIETVKSLLILAAKERDGIRIMADSEGQNPDVVKVAKSAMTLYSVVEALIEKALIPLCGAVGSLGAGGGSSGPPSGQPAARPDPPGKAELKAALEKADCESIVFDANLGNVSTFNRGKLSAAFSAGLKNQIVAKATAKGNDAAEAVRILDDAFGAVEDVDFIGRESKPYLNNRDSDDEKNGTFHTLPVKLRFTDRESRIYFENRLRELGGPRATQSLPPQVRKEVSAFADAVRAENPGKIVMVRPYSSSLTMAAFVKEDGGQKWERCGQPKPIPPEIMVPSFRTDPGAGSAGGSKHGAAGGSRAETIGELAKILSSQSQSQTQSQSQ